MSHSNFNTPRFLLAGLVLVLVTLVGNVQAGNPWDPLTGSLPQLKLPEYRPLVTPPHVKATPPYFAPRAVAVAPRPHQAAAAVAVVEYQVEYRHRTATAGQWRVAVAWTSNYTNARGVYDRMVSYRDYDVRLYKRKW